MCYKIRNKELCSKAVTDIIICSRVVHKVYSSKTAPNGFIAAGYVYKIINLREFHEKIMNHYFLLFLFFSALLMAFAFATKLWIL